MPYFKLLNIYNNDFLGKSIYSNQGSFATFLRVKRNIIVYYYYVMWVLRATDTQPCYVHYHTLKLKQYAPAEGQ